MAAELTLEGFDGVEEVGWGGFAVVFRARQASFDREVAIKVLNVRPGTNVAEAFRRECAAVGSLSGHPNIVTVHDVGETADGRPFIVMEYLHGGSLGDLVRAEGPLPPRAAAEMGVRLAGALETAHQVGLLHRDVKPENVLVSRFREPKLGDFGIARLHDGPSSGDGGVVGSVRHAAPEVLEGDPPTVASDVYSLGSTLFTMLAGRPPFGSGAGEDPLELRTRISTAPVPDLRPHGVPDTLCRVVEQALAKDPDDRQASAQEVGLQLQAALGGRDSKIGQLPLDLTPPPRSATRPRALEPIAAVAAVALVAVAAALLAGRPGSSSSGSASPRAPSTVVVPTTITVATTPGPKPGSFRDDFSGPRQLWSTSRNPASDTLFHYVDGQFRISTSNPFRPLPPILAPVSATPSHMVRIEADVTKVSSARAGFGVACGGPSSQFPYAALVDSGGWWRLVRNQEGGSGPEVRSGHDPSALVGPGPHRIVLECLGDGGHVSLTLTVDGVELATATGPRGPSFGPGPGLVVVPLGAPVEVSFDNFDLTYS